MVRRFSQQYARLINKDVPRSFLKSQESRHGHLTEVDYGKMLDDYDERFPRASGGFIKHYCDEFEE